MDGKLPHHLSMSLSFFLFHPSRSCFSHIAFTFKEKYMRACSPCCLANMWYEYLSQHMLFANDSEFDQEIVYLKIISIANPRETFVIELLYITQSRTGSCNILWSWSLRNIWCLIYECKNLTDKNELQMFSWHYSLLPLLQWIMTSQMDSCMMINNSSERK